MFSGGGKECNVAGKMSRFAFRTHLGKEVTKNRREKGGKK